MSKKKTLYIDNSGDGERCYALDYFKDELQGGGFEPPPDSFTLAEMKPDIGSGAYWCSENDWTLDNTRESCGKFNCKDYSPCNGKNGRCRHLKHSMVETGRVFDLRQTEDKSGFIFKQIAQEK